MKKFSRTFSGLTRLTGVALLGLGLLAGMNPNQAAANTAAHNIIRNTATITYADAAGTGQAPVLATMDITVLLKQSAVNYPAPPPANQATFAGTPVTYNYTITATANGLDTYTLSGPITESAGISGSTAAINGGVLTVDLGATTFVSSVDNAGKTTITVPSDGANDGKVNGLVIGSKVVIGGNLYTVDAINDGNGGNPGTSTITLTTLLSTSPAIGDVIGEQYAFTVVVTPGTVSDATTFQTIDVALSTTAGAVRTHTTRTTVTAVSLTINKYVRNVFNATGNAGGAGSVPINTVNYYASGVTGEPGDTLEYVIAIANGAAAATATKVIISDPIQPFTTYVPSSMLVSTAGGAWSAALNDGQADGDAGEFDPVAKKVYIFAGAGGAGDNNGTFGNGNGGSLPAATTTYGAFRVTID